MYIMLISKGVQIYEKKSHDIQYKVDLTMNSA